jgi:hypothetical protein
MTFFPHLESTLSLPVLLFFALAVIGMTHIIVDSSIFQPVRDWVKNKLPGFFSRIIECYQCCGTWVGFFVTFWLISWHPVVVLLGGCAASFLSYLAAVVLTYFESQSVVQTPKEQ